MACNVKIYRTLGTLNEVRRHYPPHGWTLCFQRVRYCYDNGEVQDGYRFIWRRPGGNLQPSRGQARIPSLKVMREMLEEAERAGWGFYDSDNADLVFYEDEDSKVA